MIARRIALGGAQFGLNYGVSNTAGKLGDSQARELLSTAWRAGIDMLDLAPAYGDAEMRVAAARPGEATFRIISKTKVGGAPLDEIEAQARESARLAGGKLDALLVHHARELDGARGAALWQLLRRLKDQGVTARIGFSAYCEDAPLRLAERLRPDVVQAPASFLDQRLVRDGSISRLKEIGVEVHIRSIFLQGLVFLTSGRLPARLAHLAPRLEAIRDRISKANMTPLQAALAFGLHCTGADRLVVGVTTPTELAEILAAATPQAPTLDWSALRLDDDWALTPSNWS